MRGWLTWALLALWATGGPAVAEEHGRFGFVARPSAILPFPYVYAGEPRGVNVGVPRHAPGAGYARGRRPAPWRYVPDPQCVAPQCLPSYWRPVYPPEPYYGPVLPLAAVVERLARLDYRAYAAVLVGPNYQIDALDRFGSATLLIVNAKTGIIRRTLP